MPKIIDGARRMILDEARNELFAGGYDALNIRAVARGCAIAAGTVYNYFESKDILAASVMLEDWQNALAAMKDETARAGSVDAGLFAIFDAIAAFRKPYEEIWESHGLSGASQKKLFRERHALLVAQIAALVQPLLTRFGAEEGDYLPRFIAENILIASNGEYRFEETAALIGRIIKEK